jgi:hypothetical protein
MLLNAKDLHRFLHQGGSGAYLPATKPLDDWKPSGSFFNPFHGYQTSPLQILNQCLNLSS